ncbi:hypothetical protein [Shinella zoogloeoides]|uniref:hypothetical protein n=1 Tax=Shinella zoogloeoides TaxID=352475 RepID=UPI0028AB508E|nr:hypothetical protein [Shinella zoogloeoides]
MQVTDEMIERGLTEYSEGGCMGLDDRERREVVTAILTTALSDKQAVEVRIKPLDWIDEDFAAQVAVLGLTYTLQNGRDGWFAAVSGGGTSAYFEGNFTTREEAKAIAQADFDKRISALVDVPAVEPVAKQWCAYEDGQQHTSWYPDGYGDRAGWEALAKRNPAKYQVVTRDLFTSPPLSREGEDSAEVERLTRPIAGIEHRTAQEVFDIMADRIRLAATRSGSGTDQKGCAE